MKNIFIILTAALVVLTGSASAQSYDYDDAGRLARVVYANGKGVAYTYDNRDNLTLINPITVPQAVQNFAIVVVPPGSAQLTWDHTGGGVGFLLQSRMPGTNQWGNDINLGIGARSVTVAIPFGESPQFRLIVIGSGASGDSAPSAVVQLPSANPLMVTTLEDEDDHALGRGWGDSLREVIEAAVPGDVINFDPEIGIVYVLFGEDPVTNGVPVIELDGGSLIVEKSITIDASALDGGVAVDAGDTSRVFLVSGDNTVLIKGLTMTGGMSGFGGALRNFGATLTLEECRLADNESPDQGGAISNVGGGILTVDQCVISGNTADEGGGIYNASDSDLHVAFSTITQNSAVLGGGINNHSSSFLVRRSTLSGNDSSTNGGGLFHAGAGGVLVNSTVHGNASGDGTGGGIAVNSGDSLVVRHCTIAENIGLGIFNDASGILTLDNTIAANNFTTLNATRDIEGNFTAVGANLVRSHTGTVLSGPSPLSSDPVLSAFGSHGGPTKTLEPLVGSPVLDAGVITPDTPSTDQQNNFRPHGSAPEIGSVETRLSGDTDLDWLTTSAGALDPVFRSSLTEYTATVPNAVTTAAVRPARGQFGQTVEVRIDGGTFVEVGNEQASADLPLAPGDNLIEVRVTAQNGVATEIYALTVVRGAPSVTNSNLLSLSTSAGPLSPVFDPEVSTYHTAVGNSTTSTTVTATVTNPAATLEVASGDGVFTSLTSGVASAPLSLHVGANAIDVRVTAEDGTSIGTYTIVVTREAVPFSNANLAALSTSAGPLTPSFSRGISFYNVIVGEEVTSATVSATKVELSATMRVRINGGGFNPLATGAPSGSLALNGGVNLIEVEVTAPDGTTTNSYTILVTQIIENLDWASEDGNNLSRDAAISADCRFVAFSSRATNLVPNDTNNGEDVFVYDRELDTVERVSVNDLGEQGDYSSGGSEPSSRHPSISADGRFVAFQSRADNFVDDDGDGNFNEGEDSNGQNSSSTGEDIFVYDRTLNTNQRISLRDNGNQLQSPRATKPSISADGRYVAFSSSDNNVVSGFSGNNNNNVYVYDRTDDVMVGISVPTSLANQANRDSLSPAISGDGNFVAFEFGVDRSSSPQYQYRDIYLFNRAALTVERITGTKIGEDADGTRSLLPSISHDGRFVVFQSNLENLDFYDTNNATDVFVYDRVEETTRRVSADSNGLNAGGGESINGAISGDGRHAVFQSGVSGLVTPPTNGSFHIFLKDLVTGELSVASRTPAGVEGNGSSSFPSVSFDARCVAFQSRATNLAALDTSSTEDVYVASTDELAPSPVAALASLTSNLGALAPGFSPGVTSYAVSVSEDVDTALLRPMTADPGATVRGRVNSGAFLPLPSGVVSPLALDAGVNVIDIEVTAADGSTIRSYALMITRAVPVPLLSGNADLAGLVPNAGTLSPVFSSETVSYSVLVPNLTTFITISPTVADPGASVTVDGTAVTSGAASGAISLAEGSNTIITTVTAEDGVTTRTYAIAVTRESGSADLAILVPSFEGLSPAFDSGTTDYTASVSGATSSVSFIPVSAQEGATVTVNGEVVAPGTSSNAIPLNPGSNVIEVVVTAQNGVTVQTYTITVDREASASPLKITSIQILPGPPRSLRLTWNSEPGVVYLLERSTSLTSWTTLGGDRLAVGATTTVDVALAEPVSGKLFLRVRHKLASDESLLITDVQYLGGVPPKLRITWESELDAVYGLERSTDLKGWAAFGGSLPSSGVTTTTDVDIVAPFDSKLFLRVRKND